VTVQTEMIVTAVPLFDLVTSARYNTEEAAALADHVVKEPEPKSDATGPHSDLSWGMRAVHLRRVVRSQP